MEKLVRAGISVVIHGYSPLHPFIDNIVLDEAQAAQEIVTHLIEKGHHRIATIAGPHFTWAGHLRKKGYLEALRHHNLPLDNELIYETRFRRGFGAEAMEQLLALPQPPTAVFAANDMLAVDAMLHAIDSGLSVPDDIAVVGFDNIPEATIVRPTLTTVWLFTPVGN